MKFHYDYRYDDHIYDFWSASGRRLVVSYAGNDLYPEDEHDLDTFEAIDNPDLTRTVIMTQPSGERIAFQSLDAFGVGGTHDFRMIWMDDVNGRRTTVSYNPGNNTTFPDKLIDPAGRWLGLVGTPNQYGGYVTDITSSDGQSVHYWADGTYHVDYSDGTSATSNQSQPDSDHITLTFSDVRPCGSMPNATYNLVKFYYKPMNYNWVVGSVTHPSDGAVVSTRSVSNYTYENYPYDVTETRGDGPSRIIHVGGDYQVSSVTDFAGHTTQVNQTYGVVHSITNARNYTTSYERGEYGSLTKVTHPDGYYKQWTYTDTAKPFFVHTYRDERGYVTTYDRFSNGVIGQANYPDGTNEGWGGLTALLQPTIHRFRNGINEGFVYDTTSGHSYSGQMTKQWVLNEAGTSWSYHIDYTYYPDGDPWAGRLKTVTDARGYTTTYKYDMLFVNGQQSPTIKCSGRGLVTEIDYADGTNEKFEYDIRGNKKKHTDQLGHTTSYEYDDYNRVMSVTVQVDASTTRTTSYTYDHYGYSINPMTHTADKPHFEITDSGKTRAFTYDQNFLLKTDTLGYGVTGESVTTSYGYDSVGNQTSVVDGMSRTTTFSFDSRNRRTYQYAPLSRTTHWVYDGASNITQITNPDATTTSKSYDSMNRVLTATDEMSHVTSYTYWPSGKVHTITDPRTKVYTLTYDPYDRILERDYPPASGTGPGTSERWDYDPNGNVTSYYNRSNQHQNYTYNSMNRETHRWWDGGTSVGTDVSSGYDLVGRVLWQTNENGRLDYTYDFAGGVTMDKQTNTGGPTVTLHPEYNDDGERADVWTSAGTWLGYDYNSRHALRAIQQWGGSAGFDWSWFEYNAAGERRYRTDYNGVQSEYNYDGAGRTDFLKITHSSTSILKQTNDRDLCDRRIWTVRDDQYGDAYVYQADSQLTQYRHTIWRPDLYPLNSADWTDTFNYDASGNRTSWNENGSVKAYSADNLNQYTSVTGATVSHTDGRGNLTQWNEWTYQYDAENHLTHVSKSGYFVDFYYDATGRLLRLNRNGTMEYRYYDGSNVFLRTQANGTWIDFTIWGPRPNEVVSRYSASSSWIFYQQDFIGGTAAITNLGGGVVERYLYDAYGREELFDGSWNPLISSPTNNPWTFTGQEFMPDIALNNYHNRFYHSELGRFLQNDPIRFTGVDLNLYRYVGNNPINSTDSTGLDDDESRAKDRRDQEKKEEQMITVRIPGREQANANQQQSEDVKRTAGVIYNETSGVYPSLKPGSKPGGTANWDPQSRQDLHNARVKIAEVANAGKHRTAAPKVPDESRLSPTAKAQWDDAQAAAQEAGGGKSDDHFVIWPSDDGSTPNPGLRARWPYSESGKIHETYGPFRVPVKVGDVPAGSNIYIFFYQGVR